MNALDLYFRRSVSHYVPVERTHPGAESAKSADHYGRRIHIDDGFEVFHTPAHLLSQSSRHLLSMCPFQQLSEHQTQFSGSHVEHLGPSILRHR